MEMARFTKIPIHLSIFGIERDEDGYILSCSIQRQEAPAGLSHPDGGSEKKGKRTHDNNEH